MVTRYDVVSSRPVVKPIFGENTCFFQLSSTLKVNLVAKIVQSAYLCVIFHLKHKI